MRTYLKRHPRITQADLARRVGVNPASVTFWLQGKHKPSWVNRDLIEEVTDGLVKAGRDWE